MKDLNKIGFREKLSYGVVNFGDELHSGFKGLFLLYFFTNILHISPGVAGTITGIAVFWDAINDPVIAHMADNHRFKNGDHLRPLLWAAIPKVIILVALFSKFTDNTTTSAVISLVLYLLASVADTFYYLPIYSLIQLAAPESKDRIALNSFLSGGSTVGGICSQLLMWPLIRLIAGLDENRKMIDPEKGFFWGAVIVGLILLIAVSFNYFSTRERIHDTFEENKKFNIIEGAKALFKEHNFRINILIHFFYGLALYPTTTYMVYYCSYVLQNEDVMTPIAGVYMIGTLVSLPFVNKIYKKVGRKKTLIGAAILMAVSNLILLIDPTSIPVNFVRVAGFGLACSPVIVMIALNRGDISDLIEYKTGNRMDGMVNNVQSFVKKAALAIVTTAMGWGMQWSGYNADLDVQPHSTVMYFVIVCGIGAVIAALCLALSAKRFTLDDELESYREN